MAELSDFSKKVMTLIKQIPKGNVATYGQIAKLAGKPQGSRGVAWILNSASEAHKLPWHRVLNSKGMISFPTDSINFKKQKRLLISEGVEFDKKNVIDMARFQWKKSSVKKKLSKNKPLMFSDVD